MLRCTGRFLCAAGANGSSSYHQRHSSQSGRHTYGDEEDDEGDERKQQMVAPGGYGMTLHDAYRIFEYKMGEEVKKEEVSKRFKKLAKMAHPDLGGSEEAFRKVREAQKILMNHSHDRANRRGKDGKARSGRPKVNIVRETHAENTKSVTWENAEEHRQVGAMDWMMGGFIATLFMYSYYSWLTSNVTKANDGRSRLQEDKVKPMNEHKMKGSTANTWHPWRASTEIKDELKVLEARRIERAEQKIADKSPFEKSSFASA
jgi:hypothetical protein